MTRGRVLLFCLLLCSTLLLGGLLDSRPATVNAAEIASDYQELQLFTDVLTIVRRSYVEEVSFKDLIYGAIDGMLLSLDPHSGFMPPDIYREMKLDTRGQFGGLGVEITLRDGLLTVVAPIEGTPAARVGLAPADQIIKIEGQLTKEMEVMEAVRMMRGEPGTSITITVMREAFEKPQDFTLVREIIKVQSVKASLLEDGYGYVRLVQFQESSANDLAEAVERLHKESQVDLKGLVLDLRNNPGGLLDQAVEVVDLFLREGQIVYTKGRELESQMDFSAKALGTEPDYPLVIMINGGSASASEIVAGALQDHGRAVILGTQSFGKGSVQTIIPLSDESGLRLTTARYYTPRGTSIQAKGITPDIEVQPGEVKETPQGHGVRERDLPNHIETKQTEEQDAGQDAVAPQVDAVLGNDYQLMRSLDLLKGWQVFQSMRQGAA